MKAARTILALFIAMAVVCLPFTGAVAANTGSMVRHQIPLHADVYAGHMDSVHTHSSHMSSAHMTSMRMASAVDVSSGDKSNAMDMTECCPTESASHANEAPCDSAHCPLMLVCAGAGLSFAAPVFSNYVFPKVVANVTPLLTTQSLRSHTSAPPFRPPRV
jgi:hypothetical protein